MSFLYKDKEDRFEVLFPQEPTVVRTKGLLPDTYTKIIKYSSQDNLETYIVSVTKVLGISGTPNDFISSALEMQQNNISGEMTNIQFEEINSLPAARFDIDFANIKASIESANGSDLTGIARSKGMMTFRENRLYNLTAMIYASSSSLNDKFDKFFNSFDLMQ